jgi:hypothetical protein
MNHAHPPVLPSVSQPPAMYAKAKPRVRLTRRPRAALPQTLYSGPITLQGQSGTLTLIFTPDSVTPPPPGPLTLPVGFRAFPPGDPWNTDISAMPVDPSSAAYLTAIGLQAPLHPDFGALYQGLPNGTPFNVIDSVKTPLIPISFNYQSESDPGPYPILSGAVVEPPTDSHLLLIDPAKMKLWEVFGAALSPGGVWTGSSGAVWDLTRLCAGQRPAGWTSADAAGLPIFPGLVRYQEVQGGVITHALRFTAPRTRRAYLSPANHWASASTDPGLPPMGLRLRLKAAVDLSALSPPAQVIGAALKRYGMLLADNGGALFLSGEPGPWSDLQLADLKKLHGADFEAVNTGAVLTADSTPPVPPAAPYINAYLGTGRVPLPPNPTVVPGSFLYMEGANFGEPAGKITFNGKPAAVWSWGATEMVIAVPAVSTKGALSTITITRADGSAFTLTAAVIVR